MSCSRDQGFMDENFRSVAGEKLSSSMQFSTALSRIFEVLNVVETWRERARSRRALQTLNDHLLKDIGLSRLDVDIETTKSFWQR